jgi:hypothetical protein
VCKATVRTFEFGVNEFDPPKYGVVIWDTSICSGNTGNVMDDLTLILLDANLIGRRTQFLHSHSFARKSGSINRKIKEKIK